MLKGPSSFTCQLAQQGPNLMWVFHLSQTHYHAVTQQCHFSGSCLFPLFIHISLLPYLIHCNTSFHPFLSHFCCMSMMSPFASNELSSPLCFDIKDLDCCQPRWMLLSLEFQHVCFSANYLFAHVSHDRQYGDFKVDNNMPN